MISASVGFHCPACVTDARQGPGRIINVANQKPQITNTIIGINVAIFLYGIFFHQATSLQSNFGMWPIGIAQGEWYRLLTSAFLHANLLHIGFNMLLLFQLGPSLEFVLGKSRFLALYLLAALGGSVASYYFSDIRTLSIGASGAIFGLMTATLILGRRRGHDMSQIVALLVVNVIIGFMASGVDWRGHFGGAAVGAVIGWAYSRNPNLKRSADQYLVLTAVAVVLVLSVLARNSQILHYFGG